MRIGFLVYVPRSGSTWLSVMISQAARDAIVIPEIRLLDLMLALGDKTITNMSRSQLAGLIHSDYQFPNLGLEQSEIDCLVDESLGKGIRVFVENIAKKYAGKQGVSPEFALFKWDNAVFLERPLAEIFPKKFYMHIIRDPRAVVQSLISTDRPYFPGQKMARGDVLYSVKTWRRKVGVVVKLARQERIVEVRYEDLLLNTNKEVESILVECGIALKEEFLEDAGKALFQVNEKERSIHKNIYDSPMAHSSDKWKTALKDWQILVIEDYLHRFMESYGYKTTLLNNCNKITLIVSRIKAGFWCGMNTLHYYCVNFMTAEPRKRTRLYKIRLALLRRFS